VKHINKICGKNAMISCLNLMVPAVTNRH